MRISHKFTFTRSNTQHSIEPNARRRSDSLHGLRDRVLVDNEVDFAGEIYNGTMFYTNRKNNG